MSQGSDSKTEAAHSSLPVKTALRARQTVARANTLLSMVAHELKTPLTSLRLQLDRLQRQMEQDKEASIGPEQLQIFTRRLDQGLSRLERQVGDLFDAAKLNTSTLRLRLEPVCPVELVRQVIDELEPQAHKQGFVLRLHARPAKKVLWDGGRVGQVISNLIANALRYGASPVDVTLTQGPFGLCIRVRDHGLGISPHDRRRVFRQFEQGDIAAQGLGLGLFLCRRLIAAHGGSLRIAQPKAGKGALFVVRLPIEVDSRGHAPGAFVDL